ncbi:MAG: HYR domain-containing protein, partial [Thaumarchaeota archaeon S13]
MVAVPLVAVAAVTLAAALAAAPLGSDAMALTVTAPPDCLVELKDPLTTWANADCGTAMVDPPGTLVTSSIVDTAVLPKGTTIVTWIATASGATVSDWQAVVVADTVLPTITVPDPPIVESTVPVPPPPTLVTSQDATVVCGEPALHNDAVVRVNCSASDPAGNKAGATTANVIKDTTAPTMTPPADVTVEATAPKMDLAPQHGEATATDSVDTDVVIKAVLADGLRVGTNTVTWVATDFSGNSASAEQTITVVDTTSPSITAPSDIDVYAKTTSATRIHKHSIANLGFPTALDIADPRVTLSANLPDYLGLGKVTATWTAEDDSGNTATDTQTITVKRGPPPPMGATTVDAKVLRTMYPSPASVNMGLILSAITDELLLVGGNSRYLHLYNTTNGDLIRKYTSPPGGIFYDSAVPIKSDEEDTHFAIECYGCPQARVLIYNHTEPDPV